MDGASRPPAPTIRPRCGDAATGELLLTLTGHGAGLTGDLLPGVLDVAFSPDGSRIATAGASKVARVWAATTGEMLLTLIGHTQGLTNIEFSPDGRLLATADAGSDGQFLSRIWDAASGEQLQVLTGHQGAVWGLAFSPIWTRLASAGQDGQPGQAVERGYGRGNDELIRATRAR